jgi:NO-binding membrane sensor protein with MHYT domain
MVKIGLSFFALLLVAGFDPMVALDGSGASDALVLAISVMHIIAMIALAYLCYRLSFSAGRASEKSK